MTSYWSHKEKGRKERLFEEPCLVLLIRGCSPCTASKATLRKEHKFGPRYEPHTTLSESCQLTVTATEEAISDHPFQKCDCLWSQTEQAKWPKPL